MQGCQLVSTPAAGAGVLLHPPAWSCQGTGGGLLHTPGRVADGAFGEGVASKGDGRRRGVAGVSADSPSSLGDADLDDVGLTLKPGVSLPLLPRGAASGALVRSGPCSGSGAEVKSLSSCC